MASGRSGSHDASEEQFELTVVSVVCREVAIQSRVAIGVTCTTANCLVAGMCVVP